MIQCFFNIFLFFVMSQLLYINVINQCDINENIYFLIFNVVFFNLFRNRFAWNFRVLRDLHKKNWRDLNNKRIWYKLKNKIRNKIRNKLNKNIWFKIHIILIHIVFIFKKKHNALEFERLFNSRHFTFSLIIILW